MLKKIYPVFKPVLIVLLWLFLWQLLALGANNSVMLVGPLETLRALWQLPFEADFVSALCFSFARIIGGFALACICGILLAVLAWHSRVTAALLAPAVLVLKAVPVASFVILLLIWAGNENLSFYVSFLLVLPILYLNTLQGLRQTDGQLLELAKLCHMPRRRRIRFLYFPTLYPHLLSAFQLALGMSWKSGVAAELIGQPQHSIGNSLYLTKINLETDRLFAWTLIIVLLSWLFERAFLKGFAGAERLNREGLRFTFRKRGQTIKSRGGQS